MAAIRVTSCHAATHHRQGAAPMPSLPAGSHRVTTMCVRGRLPKLCANGVQTSSTPARGATSETVCGLPHVLQHLDLVESLTELLLQALDGFLLVEDAAFEQGAAGDQRAFSLARWQAEDIGDDLVGGSLVCHGQHSCRLRAAVPSSPGVSQPARAWTLRVLPDR